MADLPGDICFAGPIMPEYRRWLPKLTWTSLLVYVSKTSPEWLNDADENTDRGPWVFKRGVGDLAFAVREKWAHIHIRGDGEVREAADGHARMEWLAARVTPHQPIAGIHRFSVGAILIGGGKRLWSTPLWKEVTEGLLKCNVRLIMMCGAPGHCDGPALRLMNSIRYLGKQNVQHIGTAFEGSVEMFVLGKTSGFVGELTLPPSTVVDHEDVLLTRAQWKAAVLNTPCDLQDSFDMQLPPMRTKLAVMKSMLASIWLIGDERRTAAAKIKRGDNREWRRQKAEAKWEAKRQRRWWHSSAVAEGDWRWGEGDWRRGDDEARGSTWRRSDAVEVRARDDDDVLWKSEGESDAESNALEHVSIHTPITVDDDEL